MFMTIPSLLLGILLSTLYGSVFHLFRGGGTGRLLLYVILAWIGLWVGQLIASHFGISFIKVGTLHLGVATISSWLFIGIGHWLSLVDIERKKS